MLFFVNEFQVKVFVILRLFTKEIILKIKNVINDNEMIFKYFLLC